MSSSGTYAEFIGRKVNKVRWKPEELMAPTMFVTGSWDNETVISLLRGSREVYLIRYAYTCRVTGQRCGTVGTDCRGQEFCQRLPSKTSGYYTFGRGRDTN